MILKQGLIYYYIGGYGAIDRYVIKKFNFDTLYERFYKVFQVASFEEYKDLMTGESRLMGDVLEADIDKILGSTSSKSNIYYALELGGVNLNNLYASPKSLLILMDSKHYYNGIYSDISTLYTVNSQVFKFVAQKCHKILE